MLRLRAERLRRKLTLIELSYQVKIHPATLGKIETKKMIAYRPHKDKLSAFFGIPPDGLFQEVNPDCLEEVGNSAGQIATS